LKLSNGGARYASHSFILRIRLGRVEHERFQGFGEVSQITRMPDGELHVHFKKAAVADTVSSGNLHRTSSELIFLGSGMSDTCAGADLRCRERLSILVYWQQTLILQNPGYDILYLGRF
jgi:hypothetical protein